jgi:hypothetical protein
LGGIDRAAGDDAADATPADGNSAPQQTYEQQLYQLSQQLDNIQAVLQKAAPAASHSVPAASEQPQTVLVFRDGHSIEVRNYAVIGQTLYYFSDGYRHRIALEDLDLDATKKQNDDRGVDFQVPSALRSRERPITSLVKTQVAG